MTNKIGNDQQARQTKVSQTDNQCGDTPRTRRLGKPKSSRSQSGNDSHGTDHPNIQSQKSRRFTGVSKGKIFGGILRQLIEENGIQLAHYKSEVERLERRQRQLAALSEELTAKTGENLDEDEVSEEEE